MPDLQGGGGTMQPVDISTPQDVGGGTNGVYVAPVGEPPINGVVHTVVYNGNIPMPASPPDYTKVNPETGEVETFAGN